MTKEQIYELLPQVEVQICGILIERKICEYLIAPNPNSRKEHHNRFSNMKYTATTSTGNTNMLITEDEVKIMRNIYPKGSDRKGDVKIILHKANRWLTENPEYKVQDIMDTLRKYVNSTVISANRSVLFNLNNIFYKLENNKFEKSPFSAIMEKYKQDYNKKNVQESQYLGGDDDD